MTSPGSGCERLPALRFSLRALSAFGVLTLSMTVFGLLLFLVQDAWPPLRQVDTGARDGLHTLVERHPALVTVAQLISLAGSFWVYLTVFTALAGWLTLRRRQRLAAYCVVTLIGSALLNAVVKTAVHRARPVLADPVAHANGLSFPSGHAQSAFVAYSVLLLVAFPALSRVGRCLLTGVAVVMVLAVGLSRVVLGVHYVSDVLAGYALGAVWVATMTVAFSAWRQDVGRPPVRVPAGLEADP